MSTTVAHLEGAARALPRRAPAVAQRPATTTPKSDVSNSESERSGLLAAIADRAEGFGRWLTALRSSGAMSTSAGDELTMSWLMLGAPMLPGSYRTERAPRCCSDYS